MIQKLYDCYDDSTYYIETNKKKLAYDNISVIGGMLTFFIFVSIFFIAFAIALGFGFKQYFHYLPGQVGLIILIYINKIVNEKFRLTFEQVRIYALVVYTMVIMFFSIADIQIYRESRAVFFPSAILVISCLYMDRMMLMIAYKIVLTAAFIVVDYHVKGTTIVINDLTVAILAILASTFCYMAIIMETLSRREDRLELIHKSEMDLLTGTLNKVSFEEKCEEYLSKKIIGAKATMFIFDLDNFKSINDSYGHEQGDKVLKIFAEIIQGYFHPDDLIGRVGGDEFMVLVLGDMPDGYVDRRCRSVLHEFRTIKIDEVSGATCSIGVAELSQNCRFEDLYKMADEALYKAKKMGKARYYVMNKDF